MNRFFSWIKARHLKEGSYFKVISFDIPETCVGTAWRLLANIINGSSYIHTRNLARFRDFVATQDSRHTPVFVIAMPRTIHYLLPCLDNIPQQVRENSIDIVLVANGLTCWEVNFLSSKTSFPMFKLWITPKSSMSHGHVLNLLLEGSKKDFAILDHDLYGTTSELWNELLSPQPEFMRGLFPIDKRHLNRKFPRTRSCARTTDHLDFTGLHIVAAKGPSMPSCDLHVGQRRPVPGQLCGVQLVPQMIGYRGSVTRRSESASSGQETPIAASVAAPRDNRHR